MSKEMKDQAAAAKSRQRGLTVLERQAEAERIEAEKEAEKRQRRAAKRSQLLPRTRPVADKEKDKHGGEQARGRGRQRINESGLRKDGGADVLQLQQRSKSLMSKKKWRRSMVVNTIGPAGGSVISRSDRMRASSRARPQAMWRTRRRCASGSRATSRRRVQSYVRSTRRIGT